MGRLSFMHCRLLWLITFVLATAVARADTNEMLSLLRNAARDADPGIRAQAIRSIGNLGAKAEPAVPDLIASLDDKDPLVRYEAASSLGDVKSSSLAAI